MNTLQLQRSDVSISYLDDEGIEMKQQELMGQDLVSPILQTEIETDSHRSDHFLIQSCRRGDKRAWENLLDKYERLVFSVPLQYGLSPDDAADIAQLSFTILLQSLDKLTDDSRLGAWLVTVARRHTWRLLERYRREGVNEAEDLTESISLLGQTDSNFTDRWDLLEWLEHGLSRIGDRCRELLLALYFDEQQPSYAEVATHFKMSVGSIGPTRARCLERLKQILHH